MEEEEEDPWKGKWCVYMVASCRSPIRTYVGISSDLSHRLRQHRGALRGGAKSVRAWGKTSGLRLMVVITGSSAWFVPRVATQLEYAWKETHNSLRRRRSGATLSLEGRIDALARVFERPTWTNQSPEASPTHDLQVYAAAGRLHARCLIRMRAKDAPWMPTILQLTTILQLM